MPNASVQSLTILVGHEEAQQTRARAAAHLELVALNVLRALVAVCAEVILPCTQATCRSHTCACWQLATPHFARRSRADAGSGKAELDSASTSCARTRTPVRNIALQADAPGILDIIECTLGQATVARLHAAGCEYRPLESRVACSSQTISYLVVRVSPCAVHDFLQRRALTRIQRQWARTAPGL